MKKIILIFLSVFTLVINAGLCVPFYEKDAERDLNEVNSNIYTIYNTKERCSILFKKYQVILDKYEKLKLSCPPNQCEDLTIKFLKLNKNIRILKFLNMSYTKNLERLNERKKAILNKTCLPLIYSMHHFNKKSLNKFLNEYDK